MEDKTIKKINIKIIFPEENINEPMEVNVFLNDLLEEACQKIFYRLDAKYSFHLKIDNIQIKRLPNKKIFELGLKEGDIIIDSYQKYNILQLHQIN